MKHKVITRDARRATRIAGHMSAKVKATAWRSYRRKVRQADHESDAVNYEPPKSARVTAWDIC